MKGAYISMKPWMKKTIVFLITIMTLGLYTPPIDIDASTASKAYVAEDDNNEERVAESFADLHEDAQAAPDEIHTAPLSETDAVIDSFCTQARNYTKEKLGTRISSKIDAVLLETVMENMDVALNSILAEASVDQLRYYGVSEVPAEGYGERIFNIHDYSTGKDIVRFDVRRENRPGEGYWFNFHYHLAADQFETHHALAELFWDKNMPPKWMA
jgi:hypothetical protein